MFEPSKYISRKVEALLRLLNSHRRGDIISHGEIGDAIEMPPGSDGWLYVLEKTRARFLKESGIALINERGKGYRLATPIEQITVSATGHTKRAIRQHGKAAKVLRAIPGEELTVHQSTACASRVIAEQEAQKQARQDIKATEALLKPKGGGSMWKRPDSEKAVRT